MRILHIVPTYWPAVRYGGPIYSVHELCKALAASGHDVHVFTTNVDGDRDTDVPLGQPVDVEDVKVWYFASAVGRRLYYSPTMKSMLDEKVSGFDVVHTHSVFLWPTWAAARAARRAGVPYVVSPRGMLFEDLIHRKSRLKKKLWIHLVEKQNLGRAARIHVTSEVERDGLRTLRLDLSPTVMIPNGVSLAGKPKTGKINDDVARLTTSGPYVLYLGRINWKKGLDRLLELWRGPMRARLVIAGNDEEGYTRVLKRKMEKENIRNVEIVSRFVADIDKERLLDNAEVFVLPSYSENFGNTALEALARGVPVVVTTEVGCREVVANSRGGLVLPFEHFKTGLDDLLADPRKRREMGRRGRTYAAGRLGWDCVAAEMEAAYRSMLEAA